MGGVVRRSNSQTFEGADLTAVMGGCEIDLRQASMVAGGEAVIDVFAFWGGIDIKVPEDWTVIVRAIPLMGGVEDKTRVPPAATTSKRLVIRGIVVMGGVVVKNSAPKN
jgi:predicted membrane protein